jgi:hypothetical protein
MAQPDKMKIQAYTDLEFTKKKGEPYTVTVNPGKYTHSYVVKYDETGKIGAASTEVKFDQAAPQKLKFELLFDATGVIATGPTDLDAEITAFRKVVYDYQGEIHSPYYLKVYWGKLWFRSRLTELTINYTLFQSDGTPLRAKADVTFVGCVSPKTAAEEAATTSPDMTHRVLVRAGDTLPVMTYRVYGDSRHYLEVARTNQLADFRRLKPGTLLAFPPLS